MSDPLSPRFGPRANRKAAGLTIEALALRTGYAPRYLQSVESSWETAARTRDASHAPPVRVRVRIARALDVPVDLMFQFPPPMAKHSSPMQRGTRGAGTPPSGNREGSPSADKSAGVNAERAANAGGKTKAGACRKQAPALSPLEGGTN